jgi:hypothetical protein
MQGREPEEATNDADARGDQDPWLAARLDAMEARIARIELALSAIWAAPATAEPVAGAEQLPAGWPAPPGAPAATAPAIPSLLPSAPHGPGDGWPRAGAERDAASGSGIAAAAATAGFARVDAAEAEPLPILDRITLDPIAPGRHARSEGAPAPGPSAARGTSSAPSRPRWSAADLERMVSGAGLAWVGGLALVLGALFFLGLAISRGWIGPSARVAIGLAAGIAASAGGYRVMTRRDPLVGRVLLAVGVGSWNLALFAAARLYALVPVEIALLGVLVASVWAAWVAIRANAQEVAALGLEIALGAPPVLHAAPNGTTVAYLAALLVGSALISMKRGWGWLPPIAFLLSVPQFALWIWDEPPMALALAAIAGFWLIHAVSAAGMARNARRDIVTFTASMLYGLNLFATSMLGISVIWNEGPLARGSILAAAAAASVALGLVDARFLHEAGGFAQLCGGSGGLLFAAAIPVAFDGPAVVIGWALAATLGVVLSRWRTTTWLAVSAGLYLALAAGHLLSIEFPIDEWATPAAGHAPFLSQQGLALGVWLAAMAAAGWLAGPGRIRLAVSTAAVAVLSLALPLELSGLPLLATWAVIAAAAIIPARRWHPVAGVTGLRFYSGGALLHGLLLPGLLVVWHYLTVDAPAGSFHVQLDRPAGGFAATPAIAAVIVAALLAILATTWPGMDVRAGALALMPVAVAWAVPFLTNATGTAIAWAAAGAAALGAALALARKAPAARMPLGVSGLALLEAAGFVTLTMLAPPSRLLVDPGAATLAPPLMAGIAALLALIAALASLAWASRGGGDSRWFGLAAAVTVVYLLSVATVGVFQQRIGPGVDGAAVARQAQVALSILWAVLGGASLVYGLARFRAVPRLLGLALLALAAAKVFFYDLSSLDAAYRVLSLIVVGALLLGSSYIYRRGRDRAAPAPETVRVSGAAAAAAPMVLEPTVLVIGTLGLAFAFAALVGLQGLSALRPSSLWPRSAPSTTIRPTATTVRASAFRTPSTGVVPAPLRPIVARDAATIGWDDFDGPTYRLDYSKPGLTGTGGSGILSLKSETSATWPSMETRGVLPPGKRGLVTVEVTGTSGGAIPVVILQTDPQHQRQVYIDLENDRWGAWYWSPEAGMRQPSWSHLTGTPGVPSHIEIVVEGRNLQMSVNGTTVRGSARLPDDMLGKPLTLVLAAHAPFGQPGAPFGVTFGGWALFSLPDRPVTPAP